MGLIHCNTMGYKYTWWKQLQNILVLIRSLFLTHLFHTDSCGGMHPSACCLWSFSQDSSLMAPSLPESCTTSTYFGEILLQLSLHVYKKGSMLCPREGLKVRNMVRNQFAVISAIKCPVCRSHLLKTCHHECPQTCNKQCQVANKIIRMKSLQNWQVASLVACFVMKLSNTSNIELYVTMLQCCGLKLWRPDQGQIPSSMYVCFSFCVLVCVCVPTMISPMLTWHKD